VVASGEDSGPLPRSTPFNGPPAASDFRAFTDRAAVPGRPPSDEEFEDALELALLLADCDARWGDYGAALDALDAAETLQGALRAEYEPSADTGGPSRLARSSQRRRPQVSTNP
jgi:hypothetical protein